MYMYDNPVTSPCWKIVVKRKVVNICLRNIACKKYLT